MSDPVGGAADRLVDEVLSGDPASVAVARRRVVDALRDRDLVPVIDDAALVVSELVSNAVRHAGTQVRTEVERVDGWLHIRVSDDGLGEPQLRPTEGSYGGFGLHIVEACSADWGVARAPGSKTVWATVPIGDRPRDAGCQPELSVRRAARAIRRPS